MNPAEIVKEVVRIADTHGLSKDVIDLLKEKIALLAEQITSLTENLALSESENLNLKQKVYDLEQEIDRLRPKDDLEPDTVRFLKLLFEQGPLGLREIADALAISFGIAEYHRDLLTKAKMICFIGGVFGGAREGYKLMPTGREYLVKRGHVS
jgi:hypothetical protein